jgi:hypothetical protein
VLCNGNTMTTAYQSGVDLKALRVATASGSEFDFVSFSRNITRGFGNDIRNVLEFVAVGNTIYDASYHGILVIGSAAVSLRSVKINDNLIRGSKYAGARVNGNAANFWPLVVSVNNSIVENNLVANGNAAGLDILSVVDAFLSNNWVGGTGAGAAAPAAFTNIRTLQDYNSNYYGTGVSPSTSSADTVGPVSYEDDYVMLDDAIVTY